MISLKLTQTVEYYGEFDRPTAVSLLLKGADGDLFSLREHYESLSDSELESALRAEAGLGEDTAQAVWELMKYDNEVVSEVWS